MRTSLISTLLLTVSTSLVFANPDPYVKANVNGRLPHANLGLRQSTPAVSPDGSCGAVGTGTYTCKGSAFGSCCGYGGRCGTGTECAISSGCNTLYGICDSPSAVQNATFPIPKSNSSMPMPDPAVSTAPGPVSPTVNPTIGGAGRNGSAIAPFPTVFPGSNGTTTTPLDGPGAGSRSGTQTSMPGVGGSATSVATGPPGSSGTGSGTGSGSGSGGSNGGSGSGSGGTAGSAGVGNRSGFIGTTTAPPGSVCSVFTKVHTITGAMHRFMGAV